MWFSTGRGQGPHFPFRGPSRWSPQSLALWSESAPSQPRAGPQCGGEPSVASASFSAGPASVGHLVSVMIQESVACHWSCFSSPQKCFCCMSKSFADSEQAVPPSVGSRELETVSWLWLLPLWVTGSFGFWSRTRQLKSQATGGKTWGPSPQTRLTALVPFRGCTEHCPSFEYWHPFLELKIFKGIVRSNRRGLWLKYFSFHLGLLKELVQQSWSETKQLHLLIFVLFLKSLLYLQPLSDFCLFLKPARDRILLGYTFQTSPALFNFRAFCVLKDEP